MQSNSLASALSWFLAEGADDKLLDAGAEHFWSNVTVLLSLCITVLWFLVRIVTYLFNSKAATVRAVPAACQQVQNCCG